MEKNIELLGAYERKFDGRKFIHYKEDGKEFITDGLIRHDKDVEKIISIMDKMDKFPTEELKEKNKLEEVQDVIQALEKLEKEESQIQDKITVALESTSDFQEPSVGFYTHHENMDEQILYRLVKMSENGVLEAYPDKSTIFENEEIAKEYIESHANELDVVRYDDLIFQAGVKSVENAFALEKEKEEEKSSKEVSQEERKEEMQKETGEQEKDKKQSEEKEKLVEEQTEEKNKKGIENGEKIEEIKNQLLDLYEEFEKNLFKIVHSFETTLEIDQNLFKKNIESIREQKSIMADAIKDKESERETAHYQETQNQPSNSVRVESPLKIQMDHYKTNVKEIIGYIQQYNHDNSIYTQAGRENIARDLETALRQVEKAMNQVNTIIQNIVPVQEPVQPKKEINIQKNLESMTNMSLELYKNHGNFECTMAYIKEYAKQNGMSLSNGVLNTSNLKEKFNKNASNEIKGVFEQAVHVGDRQHLSNIIKEGGFKPTNTLIDTMRSVNQHFGKDHSVKELRDLFKNQKNLSEVDKKVVKNAAETFKREESIMTKVKAILPGQ